MGKAGRAWLVDAGILLATLVPLLLTAHLPLSDLPNHLARQQVLHDWAGSATLRGFYTVHWALVPNLALEIVVQPLMLVMPVDRAMRLFVIATVVLLFGGTRSVNRALDPDVRSYRVAPLLIYGGPFQFGFLSFCFGVGLALWLTGAWLRRRGSAGVGDQLLFACGAAALLLCHLVAFGLFAVVVGTAALLDGWRQGWRAVAIRQLRAAAMLVPPFLLFMLASPTGDRARDPMIWSSWQQRADSIAAITLFSSPGPELLLLALALVGLAGVLAFRVVRPHPLSLVLVALALAWAAAPRSALGAGYLDYRLPWAASFLLVATLVPGSRWRVGARWAAAWFGPLAAARVLLIATLWWRWEAVIAPIDTALSRLPEGARLLVVQGPTRVSAGRQPSLLHVGSYAVARVHGYTPTLYASISGQVLQFRAPWRRLRHFTAPERVQAIDPAYNHLLVIDPTTAVVGPRLPLRQLARGERFALYRVSSNQAARGTMRSSSPASARLASSSS